MWIPSELVEEICSYRQIYRLDPRVPHTDFHLLDVIPMQEDMAAVDTLDVVQVGTLPRTIAHSKFEPFIEKIISIIRTLPYNDRYEYARYFMDNCTDIGTNFYLAHYPCGPYKSANSNDRHVSYFLEHPLDMNKVRWVYNKNPRATRYIIDHVDMFDLNRLYARAPDDVLKFLLQSGKQPSRFIIGNECEFAKQYCMSHISEFSPDDAIRIAAKWTDEDYILSHCNVAAHMSSFIHRTEKRIVDIVTESIIRVPPRDVRCKTALTVNPSFYEWLLMPGHEAYASRPHITQNPKCLQLIPYDDLIETCNWAMSSDD